MTMIAIIFIDEVVEEIQAFFNRRHIYGLEASYRIFGLLIHRRPISVLLLSFHIPCKKNCTFKSNESLKKVAKRSEHKSSKLEAFFYLNKIDPEAHNKLMMKFLTVMFGWNIYIYKMQERISYWSISLYIS